VMILTPLEASRQVIISVHEALPARLAHHALRRAQRLAAMSPLSTTASEGYTGMAAEATPLMRCTHGIRPLQELA
jgi:hypothetical protein